MPKALIPLGEDAQEDLLDAQVQPRERSPALVFLAGRSRGSQRTYASALDLLASLGSGGELDAVAFPWHLLRYPHTQALRAALAERYAHAGVNLRLSALRGVLKECWRLGLMSAEEYHRAADLPSIRGSTLPSGRALSQGELRALFRVCEEDDSPAGPRDAALLAILYGAGLRRSEAVALDLEDYDVESGELRVRSGKGRKERLVYAANGGRAAIDAWLEHRGRESGPLLFAVNKGGRIDPSHRLTAQAVLYILRKRGEQARVEQFSPHDLRRTFIGDLLDAGADIATVQALAGHANVQTTARYDRRPEAVKKRAAGLLQVPYRRRQVKSDPGE